MRPIGPRPARFGGLDEFRPDLRRIGVKDRLSVGRDDVPGPRRHFSVELPGRPTGIAGTDAHSFVLASIENLVEKILTGSHTHIVKDVFSALCVVV